ncbi:MAG: hypothetical protein M0019_01965 [Actinomycetota bacterium]|nr:hypothetical protein [Actinomycetota bacterium]
MLKEPWKLVSRGNWRIYPVIYLSFTLLFYVIATVIYPLTNRSHGWIYSLDFFAELRDAHLILWGGYQLLYSSGTGLVVPPLGPLSLTPLAFISSAFGLVEPFPYPIPRPTVLLVAIPYLAIYATLFFYAVRRFVLRFANAKNLFIEVCATLVASFALMPWGHVEDVAAVAFAILGYVKLSEGKLRSSSYLFGVAIAFQPFAVLFVIPTLFMLVHKYRDCVTALVRAAMPTFMVYIPLFVTSPSATISTLLHQNNFPAVDHLTVVGLLIEQRNRPIAAGPLRLLLVVFVIAASLILRNLRRDSIHSYGEVFLIVGLISAGRIFVEPVMVPYYVVPTMVYLLLAGVFFKSHVKVRTLAILVASFISFYLTSIRISAVAYSAFVYSEVVIVAAVSSMWYLRFSLRSEVNRQLITPYSFGELSLVEGGGPPRSSRNRFGVATSEEAIDIDGVSSGGLSGGNES